MILKLKFIGFNRKEEILEIKERKRYFEILEELKINPETVVLLRDSTPVPVDDFAEEGELTVLE